MRRFGTTAFTPFRADEEKRIDPKLRDQGSMCRPCAWNPQELGAAQPSALQEAPIFKPGIHLCKPTWNLHVLSHHGNVPRDPSRIVYLEKIRLRLI